MAINKVFLLGNLGADPELRYTSGQNAVCQLRIATTEKRKGADGNWTDHTEWHQVVVWGKQGENCKQYLAKGRQAFIEGRLQTRKWQDKEGNNRYSTEIVASNVQFVGGRGDSSSQASYSQGSSQGNSMPDFGGDSMDDPFASVKPADSISLDDDDIPF